MSPHAAAAALALHAATHQRLWDEATPRDARTKLGSKPVRE